VSPTLAALIIGFLVGMAFGICLRRDPDRVTAPERHRGHTPPFRMPRRP
jgi:hypothetical protein